MRNHSAKQLANNSERLLSFIFKSKIAAGLQV